MDQHFSLLLVFGNISNAHILQAGHQAPVKRQGLSDLHHHLRFPAKTYMGAASRLTSDEFIHSIGSGDPKHQRSLIRGHIKSERHERTAQPLEGYKLGDRLIFSGGEPEGQPIS